MCVVLTFFVSAINLHIAICVLCIGDGCMNGISKGDVWKIQLGKYLK